MSVVNPEEEYFLSEDLIGLRTGAFFQKLLFFVVFPSE